MNDPEALKNYVDMIKNNPAMMQQVSQQMGVTPDQMLSQLTTMTSMMGYFHTARGVVTNKVV